MKTNEVGRTIVKMISRCFPVFLSQGVHICNFFKPIVAFIIMQE